jgi:hypothetical protein
VQNNYRAQLRPLVESGAFVQTAEEARFGYSHVSNGRLNFRMAGIGQVTQRCGKVGRADD